MHGRTCTAATPRMGSSRADRLSARERRRELAKLIAIGLARAIAIRVEPATESTEAEEPGVDGLALSATSRLSVHTDETSDRNESKAGERT